MAKQILNKGSSANDGNGDTLRQGAQKINENFTELYTILGGDSLTNAVRFNATGVEFEGSGNDDAHETTLTVVTPTADRTITLPNATGTVVLHDATQTLTNKTLTSPILTNAVLNPTATTAGKIEFLEGTNNGTNKATLIGPSSTADVTLTLPSATDTLIGKATTDTLTNKTLTSPKIGTEIQDASGNELVEITSTGNAVNHFKITNAATGNNPTLEAAGSDNNVGLNVASKGTGLVTVTTGSAFSSGTSSIITEGNGHIMSLSKTTHIFNSSAGTYASSLANGTQGQIIFAINKNSSTVTITPANFGAGQSIALAQHKTATLMFDGTQWQLISTHGGTVA
jgi:hypothetical protein